MKFITVLFLLIASTAMAVTLPDPAITPGMALPVTAAQICVAGYSKTVRNVPMSLKLQVYRAYGMEQPRTGYCSGLQGCEVDHLISLELGGSNDPANLWPQPYDGVLNAHDKDRLENELHRLVCAGDLSLEEAQTEIRTDWTAAFRKYLNVRD